MGHAKGQAKRPIEASLESCWARMFGYAMSLTRDRESARDLVQQAALQALASDQPPADPNHARAWLFKIVRNAWIDQFRRTQTKREDDRLPDIEAADWAFDDRMIAEITVRQGLERINSSYREVIELVDLYGFQYSDVATVLHVPIGTVMSRLSRARLALLDAITNANVTSIAPAYGKHQRI